MEVQISQPLTIPDVQAASAWIRRYDEDTLETQIALSEIPAPPFGEAERGARMLEHFRAAGLSNARVDDAGNVLADRPGSVSEAPLVVSAHLDTVFPAETDVSVTRDGDLLRGPGIADDARGLATLVTVARALQAVGIGTRTPLLFVATVGEEGIGDLRGVKHLFRDQAGELAASGFISLDGAGVDRIVTQALGSRRYRLTCRGPGGHSWVDWGKPNPIHDLTSIAADLTRLRLSTRPTATLTISRIGGGKSVNAIPQSAWLEIDTRCAAPDVLDDLESRIRQVVNQRARAVPRLDFSIEIIGDRPGGATAPDAPLVQAAIAATRHQGTEPILSISSTDANVPMSLGVPAVTLGCGGEAGLAHTTDEWFRNVEGPDGIVRALHTVLLAAGAD